MNGLPATVDIERFAQARSFEIGAMQSAIKNATEAASHRVWQTLPRHLRRRAASHDVRRVPVRLREKAKLEIDPVKRRKFMKLLKRKRRLARGSGRTQKFRNRQKNKTWLETHLWHAKRMHMLDIWGYRLAVRPTEKSFRPSHRAAVHGSTINDVSYMATLEIVGDLDSLALLLKQCCELGGVGPWAARYTSGARACQTHIYEAGVWPRGLIAPVTVIWRPEDSDKTGTSAETPPLPSKLASSNPTRALWIRVHPAALESTMTSLKTASEQIPASDQLEITDLSGDINSFELVGPRTSQVIHGAFKLAGNESEAKQFWRSLSNARSPGSFSSGMIVGLTVHDPRLNFPPTNAKIDGNVVFSETSFVTPDPRLARSELWEQGVRDKLRTPVFKKGELDNKRRSQNLTPGSHLCPTDKDDKIPILLIRHSTSNNRLQTSTDVASEQALYGWTLMLPPSWSMPFLASLVHTGTRAVGLAARHHQRLESRSPHFPDDYVGAPAYVRMVTEQATAERAKWERTPKGKRINFGALGILHPWLSNWGGLVGNPPSDPALSDLVPTDHSLRHSPAQKPWLFFPSDINQLVQDIARNPHTSDAQAFGERLNSHRARRGIPTLENDLVLQLFDSALIHVHVDMLGRGNPHDRAILYGCESEEELRLWADAIEHQEASSCEKWALTTSPVNNLLVLGYITSGNFSLQLGHGHGIAAITLKGLIDMTRKSKDKVLVRVRNLNSTIAPPAVVTLI